MNSEQLAAVAALGDLVAAFHVEASLQPATRRLELENMAGALDAVRIDTVMDLHSDVEAFAWLDAGRIILTDARMKRTLTYSPAIRAALRRRGMDV